MARVLTNETTLIYAIEDTENDIANIGLIAGETGADGMTISGSPAWFQLEPNDIGTFGAEITKTPRQPISKSRQRRKGATTDLDSAAEFEHDLTLQAFIDFVEGFLFSTGVNTAVDRVVTNVDGTNDEYDVASIATAEANKLEFSAAEYATLIYARGFTNAANNGIKSLDADVAGSATAIGVAEDLVDEASPPANARVELAGLRSLASAADFTWDWDGTAGTATLTSAGDISDFTQFGLTVGQFVHIGSPDGSGGVQNAFENSSANDMYGYARIQSFGSGTIVFDKVDAALQFDDADAPTTAVDILFGNFIRNVDTDDSEYLTRSFQFEVSWPDLGGVGTDEYSYSRGNFSNEMTVNFELTDKATIEFGFIGTDTDNPTTSRKTNASSALAPLGTEAFNTSSDFARLRITDTDESGLDTIFKSLSITFNNNVSPEKVLNTLGAYAMNVGLLFVDIEAQLLFTNGDVIDRIRDNTTVTMDFGVKNDDGAIFFDIPSLTLGDGSFELPVNESVLVNLSGEAFEDTTLGTSLGVSTFPIVP